MTLPPIRDKTMHHDTVSAIQCERRLAGNTVLEQLAPDDRALVQGD
ncbi:hypothetical protein MESS2_1370008 [Mesorhizobium metallidurans STM 2683]|uniref:Uncharacterized protein n=1 Tax=Mesorhizobium metallidurans STM 2683 TaxID=1297569 RepID=M5EYR1_9HYPH|nr:hypothetical protein [Mesorhizobium metallidurans]CCV04711.1 hypothetical protein MESS2_1370008 [Mesorhizobium metallidurans STM 2683]